MTAIKLYGNFYCTSGNVQVGGNIYKNNLPSKMFSTCVNLDNNVFQNKPLHELFGKHKSLNLNPQQN